MRKLFRILAILLVLLLVVGGAFVGSSYKWLSQPLTTLQEPVIYEVPRGASLRAVARDLRERGVIDRPQVWIAAGRLSGKASSLKAGEYRIEPGCSPRDVLDLLSSGQVVLHGITFVEGSRFVDILAQLRANPAVRIEYANRSEEEIMRAVGKPGVHPEGQFFPDTYHFPRHTPDIEILKLASARMSAELEKAWAERAPDLPLAGPYEALILASIVEKETALDRERPLIAGVFVERLRRGMRLQTDPTVIYGIGANFDGNIRRADLLRDTPYNTYTRAGLPPTPIALPGLESLRAAVRPEVTGKLFFVATGEPDGSHYFSESFAEHQAAVQRYLQRLRSRQ
ncbi:MAG TPA: endolytic transglycosylase MltG [Steroidobacteraceae bacterium]